MMDQKMELVDYSNQIWWGTSVCSFDVFVF